jgi:hypothetical protein
LVADRDADAAVAWTLKMASDHDRSGYPSNQPRAASYRELAALLRPSEERDTHAGL